MIPFTPSATRVVCDVNKLFSCFSYCKSKKINTRDVQTTFGSGARPVTCSINFESRVGFKKRLRGRFLKIHLYTNSSFCNNEVFSVRSTRVLVAEPNSVINHGQRKRQPSYVMYDLSLPFDWFVLYLFCIAIDSKSFRVITCQLVRSWQESIRKGKTFLRWILVRFP